MKNKKIISYLTETRRSGKVFLSICVILFACTLLAFTKRDKKLQSTLNNENESSEIIDVSIKESLLYYYSNPYEFLNIWLEQPIPLSNYSENAINWQLQLNEDVDYITTKSGGLDNKRFTNDNHLKHLWDKDIDNEEITPFTWKWVQIELNKEDGNQLIANLRRPNWWLKQNNADSVGNEIDLYLPEMDIGGRGTVTRINPILLDTRLRQFIPDGNGNVHRPITGKFERSFAEVWDYHFENEIVGSTKNHPFFSEDRKRFIPIGDIEYGEKVRLKDGKAVRLLHKKKRRKREKVYNLEIWRDHNFYVGQQGLLVHNDCRSRAAGFTKQNIEDAFPELSQLQRNQLDIDIGSSLGPYNPDALSPKYKYFVDNLDGLEGAAKQQVINARLRAWKSVNGNADLLKRFEELPNNIQVLAANFTEVSLKNLIDDLIDPDFAIFLKDAENLTGVKSMLIHKGVDMTDDELDLAREIFNGLDESIPTDKTIIDWINRSEGHVRRQERFDLGNGFEDSYGLGLKNNIPGAETSEYLALKARMAASDIGKNLDEYSILKNVHLCIGTPCNKAGNFFIPDFIAVRKVIDDITEDEIWDIVIIDTKLNFDTAWSKNQNKGKILSSYKIKSVPGNSFIHGTNIVEELKILSSNEDFVVTKQNSFIKVYSDGYGNFNGGGID